MTKKIRKIKKSRYFLTFGCSRYKIQHLDMSENVRFGISIQESESLVKGGIMEKGG